MAVTTLGKVDIKTLHAFVASDNVEIGPVENIAHVKFSAWIGWRSVDAEGRLRTVLPVKVINAPLFPFMLPLFLSGEKVNFLR